MSDYYTTPEGIAERKELVNAMYAIADRVEQRVPGTTQWVGSRFDGDHRAGYDVCIGGRTFFLTDDEIRNADDDTIDAIVKELLDFSAYSIDSLRNMEDAIRKDKEDADYDLEKAKRRRQKLMNALLAVTSELRRRE